MRPLLGLLQAVEKKRCLFFIQEIGDEQINSCFLKFSLLLGSGLAPCLVLTDTLQLLTADHG